MARRVVPLVTGEKYHVFNRGIDKRIIFSSKQDYTRFYLSLMYFNTIKPTFHFRAAQGNKDSHQPPLVKILAYCLLPNHYHILLEQKVDNGISDFMKRVSAGYTGYFNEMYEREGSLFQGSYKRVLIESDEQFNYLFAYVNENHIVHNIEQPPSSVYSSSAHYAKEGLSKLISSGYSYEYDKQAAQKLARSIYQKRQEPKYLFD